MKIILIRSHSVCFLDELWVNMHKDIYLRGKFHRERGPAINDSNGAKGWRLFRWAFAKEEVNLLVKNKSKGVTYEVGDVLFLKAEAANMRDRWMKSPLLLSNTKNGYFNCESRDPPLPPYQLSLLYDKI